MSGALPYETLIDLLQSLETAPEERGVKLIGPRFRETFYPYAELFRRTMHRADRFQKHGVKPRARVLLAMPTEIDAITSFFALLWLGAVPYSTSSPLLGQDREAHRRQVRHLIALHDMDWILDSKDLEGIAGSGPEVPIEMALPYTAPEDELLTETPRVRPAEVQPGDTAFVQFSSGSTSSPKGVQITHHNMIENTTTIALNDGRSVDSVWVSWLPLYHDMGLVGGLFSNLLHQNFLVLMHPRCFVAKPLRYLEQISKHRGNVTAVPNFALDICTDRIKQSDLDKAELDLSSFRYIYNGAEPVHLDSIERFEKRFSPYGFVPGSVYPVYGMSEMTLIITAPLKDHPIVSREVEGMLVPSVGVPLRDTHLLIRDESRADLPVGRIGEVWVRGSSLTPGYLPEPSPEENPIRDGWLATGDLGLLDDEGRLFITGRIKDLIIYQGRNFYGHDIAAGIEDLPCVPRGKVFVFDVDNHGATEIAVMLAPPTADQDGVTLDREEYKAQIHRFVLAEYGLPVHDVLITGNLPKTTSGKFARHQCQQLYLGTKRVGGKDSDAE